MPAAAPAPASEPAADAKERILVAGVAAFAERGFDGATTRDIAARAGVNLGLIQYYFEGKENLWRAAVDRTFAEIRAGIRSVLEDPALTDDDARTRRLIRSFVGFVARNPEFIRIMHDEGKRAGPRLDWLVEHHVKSLYETVRVLLERSRDRGLLPAHIDPLHFHYILIGAIALIFHQAEECRRLTGVDPSDPAVIGAHADAVEHLLLGPENPEAPR